ncbi:hypothetical protein [Sphingomonas sp.]|uniref:hypothetical protein n=1 Tax=Sphingomonas sp. TaxID=28214 RepID=UPI0025F2FFE2|nr:hypothetical protein [Sphingomonas sp.]
MPKTLILIAALIAASPLSAKSLPLDNKPPTQVARLLACKDLADSAARLACYDRETAAVGDAINRRDLVMVDREAVKTARRSLFGFSIPSLGGILGNDRDELKELDGQVAFASQRGDGTYVIGLQDGTQWTQTDDRTLALDPRKGDKVFVHRAAMGSYMLNVGRMPGIRVKRVN